MKEEQIEEERPLSFRPVAQGDRVFLFDLYASTRADEMSLIDWDDEKKQAFLEMQFTAQQTSYGGNFPQAQHDIILLEQEGIGRLYVNRCGDEIRLLDITLLPAFRNRGIGSQILTHLQEEAAREANPIRFYVWQLNHGALRFYERHGCQLVSEEGAYYLMHWLPPSLKTGTDHFRPVTMSVTAA